MTIENATREDAPFIADAILEAIGEDITLDLAGESLSAKDVHDLFQRLAERDDTQYSYLNTRIVRNQEGEPIGACISYDGGDLRTLRIPFFREANETLGWGLTDEEIEEWPGETEPDEFYLDTLMVLPQDRGQGIARALIADAKLKADRGGKPLGLLCDLDNDRAHHLYESVGFRNLGERPFAGHIMHHMQIVER
ncbi:MAG: GNAT family N-acetyltransferase [Muribaculaceae bacterium]|nr:GNAT family N-acetyltransferase [Muribaculaceae bacterium]